MAAQGRMYGVCVVLSWFLACSALHEGYKPTRVVTTTYGDVQGQTKALFSGEVYDEFLGIPFGAPPTGDGRFRKPATPAAWNGTRQTVEYGPKCIQIIAKGDEDCLYLNVVVPGGLGAHGELLPVMVYSYGGAFILGSADQYPAHGLAVPAKVITVTYNYRVGPIGFMSTGDEWSPGNYGLWDARAAFIWVRDNIKSFGGDPSRVTAFGQSAGGVVSSHFLTSPLTKGLVHRVLSMSGTSTAFFGTVSANKKIARNLGVASLCPIWSNKAMVKCLRNKKAGAVDFNGYVAGIMLGGQVPAWPPVIDHDFVTEPPKDALEKGLGSDIDLMIGRTQDDGAGLVYTNPFGMKDFGLNVARDPFLLDTFMKALLKPFGNTTAQLTAIKEQYPDLRSEDVLTRTKAASQTLTDFAFASSAHQVAGLHAKHAAPKGRGTYLYNFRYRNSFMHYEPWVNGSHVDDVWLVFGEEFNAGVRNNLLGNFSDTDRLVGRHLAHYYGNFAHTGDPNKGPHEVPTEWPQYNPDIQQYMEQNEAMNIKAVTPEMRRRYTFWTETWPGIIGQSKSTGHRRNDNHDFLSAAQIFKKHIQKYIRHVKGASNV